MIKGRTGLAQPYDTQEMSTDDSVWTVLGDMLHGQILLKLRNKSQDSNRLKKKEPFNASRVLDNLKHSCTECILKVLL